MFSNNLTGKKHLKHIKGKYNLAQDDCFNCNLSGWGLKLNFVLLPTGNFKGMCKQIDHFPEETDYEADPSEYFLREYMSLIPVKSLKHDPEQTPYRAFYVSF